VLANIQIAGQIANGTEFEILLGQGAAEAGSPAGGDEPDPDINEKFAHKLAFLDEMRAAPHPRSYIAVEALAPLRGSTAGVPAAEAFVTIRDRW
jgi:hypothetical protein